MLSLLKHVPPSLVGVNPSSRNVIDGLQPLESNKYQVEFDPGIRELVSTCEKNKSPSQDHNKFTLKLVS